MLTKTQIACGGKTLAGQIAVYYNPKQLNVVRFNKAGSNATVLYQDRALSREPQLSGSARPMKRR